MSTYPFLGIRRGYRSYVCAEEWVAVRVAVLTLATGQGYVKY